MAKNTAKSEKPDTGKPSRKDQLPVKIIIPRMGDNSQTNDSQNKDTKSGFAGRMKMGRPTDYRVEFCDVVVELGAQGKSRAQIAAYLDIMRSTLAEWEAKHSDFSAAMTRARDLCLSWWEEAGMAGMFMGHKFNDRAWSLQVRNRFPKEYRESQALELAGADGGAITINILPVDEKL